MTNNTSESSPLIDKNYSRNKPNKCWLFIFSILLSVLIIVSVIALIDIILFYCLLKVLALSTDTTLTLVLMTDGIILVIIFCIVIGVIIYEYSMRCYSKCFSRVYNTATEQV